MKNFPRGCFSKLCKSSEYFGGVGGYKLMYTHREDEYQLQVSNYILKIAWPLLIFGKFTIHTSRTILKSRFFPQF